MCKVIDYYCIIVKKEGPKELKQLVYNGMLVKRPLLIDGDTVLIGFKEAEWSEKLG